MLEYWWDGGIVLLTYTQILFYANAGVTKEGSMEGGGYVSLYLSCEVRLSIIVVEDLSLMLLAIAYHGREGSRFGGFRKVVH